MENIIEELYFGKINPSERKKASDLGYTDIINRLNEEEKYLDEKLSEESYQHFQNFKKWMHQAASFDEVEAFKAGYRIGALMGMEVVNVRKV